MASPTLVGLPEEVLSDICDWVYWGHCSDLLEFALVSRHFYSVAKPLLYRTLRLNLVDPLEFAMTIQECRNKLVRDNAFKFVRCLYITTEPVSRPRKTGGSTKHHQQPQQWRYPTFCRDYQGLKDRRNFSGWMKQGTPAYLALEKKDFISSDTWKALFDLMAQLPAMGDLHYLVGEELQLALLEVLSNKEKPCRLHLHGRHLYSIEMTPRDPDALAFLHSPLLHTAYGSSYSLLTGSTEPLLAKLRTSQVVPSLKELYLDVSTMARMCPRHQQPLKLSVLSPMRSLVINENPFPKGPSTTCCCGSMNGSQAGNPVPH